jgi:hypothetical protein
MKHKEIPVHKAVVSALAGVFLLAGLLGAAEPVVKKDVVEKYVKALAATVPSGWTVCITDDADGIWIERKEAVPMHSTLPNPPLNTPDASPEFGKPTLWLRIGPARTQADIAAMTKQNESRAKALEMLRSQMADMVRMSRPTAGGDEDFQATTPEQQAKLDAFRAVKKAMPYQPIPKLYAEDASFSWGPQWSSPDDENVFAEQQRIQAIVESAFSKKPLK